jgi:hypothetical protein
MAALNPGLQRFASSRRSSLPRIGDADGEKSSSPAKSVSDPMAGIAESGAADSQMR